MTDVVDMYCTAALFIAPARRACPGRAQLHAARHAPVNGPGLCPRRGRPADPKHAPSLPCQPSCSSSLGQDLVDVDHAFLCSLQSIYEQQRQPPLRSSPVDVDCPLALLLPNLATVPRCSRSRAVTVEIKPKRGWPWPANPAWCRFCLHKELKRARGKWAVNTAYCPSDLFSAQARTRVRLFVMVKLGPLPMLFPLLQSERIQRALSALISTPQVWRNCCCLLTVIREKKNAQALATPSRTTCAFSPATGCCSATSCWCVKRQQRAASSKSTCCSGFKTSTTPRPPPLPPPPRPPSSGCSALFSRQVVRLVRSHPLGLSVSHPTALRLSRLWSRAGCCRTS